METPASVSSRSRSLGLIALFLAPVLAVTIGDSCTRLASGRPPVWTELFTLVPTEKQLRRTEKRLEENSWMFRTARPWAQWALFEILGQAGHDIVVGKDGWLFYRPGLRYLIEPLPAKSVAGAPNDPVQAIVSFRDQLAAHDIRLLVVPIPVKASLQPGQLSNRAAGRTTDISRHSLALAQDLRDAGVEVLDLRPTLAGQNGESLYLKTDTHWRPEGAALAAQTVADWLVAHRWIERGTEKFTQQARTISHSGDLVAMIKSPLLEKRIPPETLVCQQIVRSDGKPYADDPRSGILVLGDSFLRIFHRDAPGSAGFIAHLAFNLQQPLHAIVSDGGASTLVRQELARRPGILASKRVVIWEFVERDYRFGSEGWRDLRLPENLFTAPAAAQ